MYYMIIVILLLISLLITYFTDSISVIQVDLSTLSPIPYGDSTVNKSSVQSEIFVIYV